MAQADKRGSQFATAAKQSFRDSAQAALAPFGFPVTLTARLAQALRSQQARDALAKKFERVTSLDPQEQTLTDMAVEGVASLAPGVGQALAVRDVERARRANDPAGMAMAASGAIPGGRLARLLKRYDPVIARIDAYHGTADDFDVFDPKMGGRATGAESAKQATWFVDKPEVAKGYAVYAAEYAPVARQLKDADRLERIAQRSNKQADWDKYDEAVRKAEALEAASYDRRAANAKLLQVDIPDETKFLEVDAKGKTPAELSIEGNIDSWLQQQLQKARRQNKEGVKISNFDDAAGLTNAPATHYAVFDPSRVKIKSKEKLVK